jgi:hypothetical protein
MMLSLWALVVLVFVQLLVSLKLVSTLLVSQSFFLLVLILSLLK